MIEQVTWKEMFEYLREQENCIIKDKEITIPNLYKTLNLYNNMIKNHDPDDRLNNLNCKCLKLSLQRIYKAHRQNKFKKIELI